MLLCALIEGGVLVDAKSPERFYVPPRRDGLDRLLTLLSATQGVKFPDKEFRTLRRRFGFLLVTFA